MISMYGALFRPIHKFLQHQAASSVLLLTATVFALIWANSPWQASYHDLWHAPITLGFGPYVFSESLHFWINDALMAIFFLVVGLEIKRELIVGELSTPRQAALPIFAAIGGMIAPACVYFLINPPGSEFSAGWGIPAVTDIAFAIGVLTVLGSRVPFGLKVFLTALAIVDDLGAILLIALFYSGGLNITFLLAALLVCIVLFTLNRSGVDKPAPYLLLGFVLWLMVLQSGLHATISGVLLALMIPARAKIDPSAFHQSAEGSLKRFQIAGIPKDNRILLTNHEHQASVQALETLCEEVQAPLQRVEHGFTPWVTYLILPLFAMANAGVSINLSHFSDTITHPAALGIIAGLFFGKQIGITLFSWIGVRLGLVSLPVGVRWSGIYGASILGGIGFTMSLFISLLAFTDQTTIDSAKLGILCVSMLSGVIGVLVLNQVLGKEKPHEKNPVSH